MPIFIEDFSKKHGGEQEIEITEGNVIRFELTNGVNFSCVVSDDSLCIYKKGLNVESQKMIKVSAYSSNKIFIQ